MKTNTLAALYVVAGVLGVSLIVAENYFYDKNSEYDSAQSSLQNFLSWCGNRKGSPLDKEDLASQKYNANIKTISSRLSTYTTAKDYSSKRYAKGRIILDKQGALVGCTVDEEVGWR